VARARRRMVGQMVAVVGAGEWARRRVVSMAMVARARRKTEMMAVWAGTARGGRWVAVRARQMAERKAGEKAVAMVMQRAVAKVRQRAAAKARRTVAVRARQMVV